MIAPPLLLVIEEKTLDYSNDILDNLLEISGEIIKSPGTLIT